jgi:hypothetical protein
VPALQNQALLGCSAIFGGGASISLVLGTGEQGELCEIVYDFSFYYVSQYVQIDQEAQHILLQPAFNLGLLVSEHGGGFWD